MFKLGDIVKREEINKMINKAADLRVRTVTKDKEIKMGDKVFFHSSSHVSRAKFKEDYPGVNRVAKMDNADYIFVNPGRLCVPSVSTWSIFRNTSSVAGVRGKMLSDEEPLRRLFDVDQLNKLQQYIHFLEGDKELVSDSCITIKGLREKDDLINEEEMQRVTEMMSSNDKEMVRLGWSILTSFDIEKNMERYLLVLASCKSLHWIRWTRTNKMVKEKLKTRYPNLNI